MKKTERRYRVPINRWVALALALVVSAGVVVLACGWYSAAREAYFAPQDSVTVTVAGAKELPVSDTAKERYGVESAAQALDAAGQPTGYVIVTAQKGYKSVIRVQSTFTLDGKLLAGMKVLEQDETEYLGVLVQTEGFMAQFAGRKLPMRLWNDVRLGSPIDALSGATVSSQAVVDAVNNAYAYVKELKD